ncbi:hypothetical protein M409DRAFT_26949 [Zasmidium cellare ATCC 36951]|uniref:F-box domain-containing protein n=1 Tax=Zasmidium cellare ATCC 36951 TaxID=1080233 RepID=A0A6A6C9Y9_ZASCE|nr:uncharacterized protein M409DRAFT_26949 [Zasmidium cellare ATCC 36951]KAF2162712.1 hypothetical protein M409DRAFT_26949 [Zasmidium cellare ATCC 36951]
MTEQGLPSHLLALPRELRDIIYEYTFTTVVQITDRSSASHNAGLLSTCHQTRAEAVKLYYLRTTFETTGHDRRSVEGNLVRFFRSVPSQSVGLIQAVYVHVEVPIFTGDFAVYRHRNQRMRYENLYVSLGPRLPRQAPGLRKILKVKVWSWNGRENEEVWTSNPYGEKMPRV